MVSYPSLHMPFLRRAVEGCLHLCLFIVCGASWCFWLFPSISDAEEPGTGSDPAGSSAETREVVVGVYTSSYPYSFRESPDGKLQGFAVELLDALARVMNFRIRREVPVGEDLQSRFRAGDYDMLQMLSESKGREEWADYSVPVLYTQNVPFVRLSKHTPRKFEDIEGGLFAVAGRGSVSDLFLRARAPGLRIIYPDSPAQALQLVDSGKADATMVSRLTAVSLVDKLHLHNITELRDPSTYIEQRHSFAVHKGDTALLARLNEGLAILQRSGEYEQIYRKWLGRYEPAKFSRVQVISYAAAALAVALVLAVWAWLRQRSLRGRLAAQAGDLAEQGELVSALYENVPLAMFVFDLAPEGARLRSLNRRACEFLGVQVSTVIGRRLEEIQTAPDWVELGRNVLARAREHDVIATEKHTLPILQRHLMVTRVPLAPRMGGVSRLCLLVEDVTERWRLDEEVALGRRLRAIGELVGGIAHEFNNLMTPVMLKIGIIRATRPDDQELQADLAVAGTAVQRAAELTARLLTFGRKGERGVEPVSLAVVVRGAFDLLRPTFDRRIVWEDAVPRELPPLLFNATDLNQILVNLLLNARDTLLDKLDVQNVSGWTPKIRVAVEQLPPSAQVKPAAFAPCDLGGWQRLVVQDNGLGMSAAVQERIFEPFYTTKQTGKGTGLGLATVWHLVTVAGGRIELETTPGDGSTFYVWLPVLVAPVVPAAKKPGTARVPGAVGDILLVDDEKIIVDTMSLVLCASGHRVQSIGDGNAAWAYLQVNLHKHDLLILDINMPGIDGLELSKRVRAAGYTGRILIVSGRLATAEPRQFEGVAINGVLPKPFDRGELLAAVENCMNR